MKGPSSGPVTREQFQRLTSVVEECCAKLDLQFKRIAQIQAELDHIRAAWNSREQRVPTRQK